MKRLNIVILACNSLVLLLTIARLLAVNNIYYQLAILVIVAILLVVSMVLTMGIVAVLYGEKNYDVLSVVVDAFCDVKGECEAKGESEGGDIR